jgi:hypothetical protein
MEATDLYFWRNVDRKPCGICGDVHEFVTKSCVPILFTDEFIKYERRLAQDEFAKAVDIRTEWGQGGLNGGFTSRT